MRRAAGAAALLIALACSTFHGVRADDSPAPAPAAPARSVVTHHVVHLANGEALAYTATAGTLTLRNDRNEPTANIFYVAYTTGDRQRPVTFLYNGGPGSASLWLHIGAFGPRRIVMSNTSPIPPAGGRLADNPSTLLDTSDLVFIDPVGTGYSSVTGKGTDKDFWGVDEDIRAFSQFIRRWVAANDRAGSPKFLLGESYGTFRSAGLVDRLQNDGMAFNGVILLSSLLDYADDFGNPGDENLPDAFAIPSEAAVAWYHKKVPDPPADVQTFIDAARRFTSDEYLPAVLRAGPLDAPAQAQLAQRLHAFIGLDPDYLLRANLRVSPARFESELLRADGRIIGRYDGRFVGQRDGPQRGRTGVRPVLRGRRAGVHHHVHGLREGRAGLAHRQALPRAAGRCGQQLELPAPRLLRPRARPDRDSRSARGPAREPEPARLRRPTVCSIWRRRSTPPSTSWPTSVSTRPYARASRSATIRPGI